MRAVSAGSPWVLTGECAQCVDSSAAARCGTVAASTSDRRGRIAPSGWRITSYAAVRAATAVESGITSMCSA